MITLVIAVHNSKSSWGSNKQKILNLNLHEFYAFIINNREKNFWIIRWICAMKYKQDSIGIIKNKEFRIPHEEYYPIVKNSKKCKNFKQKCIFWI